MNFPQAVGSGIVNIFNYRTRASRSEFWWFYLFSALAFIAGCIIDDYVLAIDDDINSFDVNNFGSDPSVPFVVWFWLILLLILFLPASALGVRRLHDINHRGWWMLVPFLIAPIIPSIIPSIMGTEGEIGWWMLWMLSPFLIYGFALIKGTEGENRFGHDPRRALADASGDASATELLSRDDPPQDAPTSDEAAPESDPPTQQHVHVHVHMPGFAPTDSDKASLEEQAEK